MVVLYLYELVKYMRGMCFCRGAVIGAGGAVDPQTAPVLCGVRLHGPYGRSEGQGDQARHSQRAGRIRFYRPRRAYGAHLPRDHQNGEYPLPLPF